MKIKLYRIIYEAAKLNKEFRIVNAIKVPSFVHLRSVASCRTTLNPWECPLWQNPGPTLAGAGPSARPRCGALLSSGFMTSSCSANRVTSADIKT